MFSDKTLVAIGCSHVYGTFLDKNTPEECKNRSWVKKLEKLAGFKDSINLASPGVSNKRSYRVIREYVLNNLDRAKDFIIFFGITELSRTEFPTAKHVGLVNDRIRDENSNTRYVCTAITSTNIISPDGVYYIDQPDLNPRVAEFLKLYYGMFSIEDYDIDQLNLDLISLHTFFKHFNIEHYFVFMMNGPKIINGAMNTVLKDQLPIIAFQNNNALEYAKSCGFKAGECKHLDHDGNECLANYIYNNITTRKGQI